MDGVTNGHGLFVGLGLVATSMLLPRQAQCAPYLRPSWSAKLCGDCLTQLPVVMLPDLLTYHDNDSFYIVSQCFITALFPIRARICVGLQHTRGAMREKMNGSDTWSVFVLAKYSFKLVL